MPSDQIVLLANEIIMACREHAKTHDNRRKDDFVAAAQRRAQRIMEIVSCPVS